MVRNVFRPDNPGCTTELKVRDPVCYGDRGIDSDFRDVGKERSSRKAVCRFPTKCTPTGQLFLEAQPCAPLPSYVLSNPFTWKALRLILWVNSSITFQ